MKTVPLKPALTAAIHAARTAGIVMRDNWHAPKRVNATDAHDIKLELDVRSQKLIEKILRKAFPQIPLLGEEGVSGPSSRRFDAASIVNAEYRWVVDPIDGTVNYAFGIPHAAVSIALQKRDKRQVAGDKSSSRSRARNPITCHPSHVTLLGVIYGPFTNELWTAVRGGPTRLNGRVVHVSRRRNLNEAVVAMGFSKSKQNLAKSLPHLIRLSRRTLKIRIMGSAALELAYVATGRLDAYIERTINLWDIAAGGLMVECSGGEFYTRPAPGEKFRMCASNGKLRKKLQLDHLLK